MARTIKDKSIDRETVLNSCADQMLALAKRKCLTIDELMKVMRRTRKAAVSNATIK